MNETRSTVDYQTNKTATRKHNVNYQREATFDMELVKRFCTPLSTRDMAMREMALDVIEKTVEGWLEGYGSPKKCRYDECDDFYEVETDESGDIVLKETKPNHYLSLVTLHLPAILRLSVSCPFEDVRDKFLKILKSIRDRGLTVPNQYDNGPSNFIPLPASGSFSAEALLTSLCNLPNLWTYAFRGTHFYYWCEISIVQRIKKRNWLELALF
ncbi:hypothetical protein RUM44_004562 [Polyplax serrata]|uniref:Uncharacterized protein n=1 Tax=Polyplax serrata TaxID=468196 RepID=A0ABR1B371_POLSC